MASDSEESHAIVAGDAPPPDFRITVFSRAIHELEQPFDKTKEGGGRCWESIAEAFENAIFYYLSNLPETTLTGRSVPPELTPRRFVAQCMIQCVNEAFEYTLLGFRPGCLEDLLICAVSICAKDLRARVKYWESNGDDALNAGIDVYGWCDSTTACDWQSYQCPVMHVLAAIFGRDWHCGEIVLPLYQRRCMLLRNQAIKAFKLIGGFRYLYKYLSICASTATRNGRVCKWRFPYIKELSLIMQGVADAVPVHVWPEKQRELGLENEEDSVVVSANGFIFSRESDIFYCRTGLGISRTILHHLFFAMEDFRDCSDTESINLKKLMEFLMELADNIGPSRRFPASGSRIDADIDAVSSRNEFNGIYQDILFLLLKYFKSCSNRLRILGIDVLDSVVNHAKNMRPPRRGYEVRGAGLSIVNGEYILETELGVDGWGVVTEREDGIEPPGSIRFLRQVCGGETQEASGETFKLYRDVDENFWVISQTAPYTEKLYGRKCEDEADSRFPPPRDGWRYDRSFSFGPPPTVYPLRGFMIPSGQEHLTLEAQVSNWVVTNNVLKCMVGGDENSDCVDEMRGRKLLDFMITHEPSYVFRNIPNCVLPEALAQVGKTSGLDGVFKFVHSRNEAVTADIGEKISMKRATTDAE